MIDWCGTTFRIIDTGGYTPGEEDDFTIGIREQVELAVAEADLLLVVVDAIDGITPIDNEIAGIVLKTGKPVVLTVNKSDNLEREKSVYDFFAVGMGDPLPIAAESGRGIGDLLDRIVEQLPKQDYEQVIEERIHLAIVGKPNVGKSSFVNALLKENKVLVSDQPGTTRDSIDSFFRFYGHTFVLIDTAGLRRKAQIRDKVEFYSTIRTLHSLDRADVAVVLMDAADGLTHQDKRIIAEVVSRKKGLILAINKWDLIEKDEKTMAQFEKNVRGVLGNLDYMPIIMISCKHNLRLQQIIQMAMTVYQERKKRIPTAKLNDTLGRLLREKPPLVKDARPVKVHYLTQVGTEPPVFALFTNRPQAIAANYKRFVEKKIREKFGFFGSPMSLVIRRK